MFLALSFWSQSFHCFDDSSLVIRAKTAKVITKSFGKEGEKIGMKKKYQRRTQKLKHQVLISQMIHLKWISLWLVETVSTVETEMWIAWCNDEYE